VAVEEKVMHEHLTHAIYYCEVHLIYSAIVWLAAWALTSIPVGSATTKHWIWVAAALNFVLPFGAVLDGFLAPHITWAKPLGVVGGLGASLAENTPIAASLAAVWLVGATSMLARLCVRIATERRSARASVDECRLACSRWFHARGLPVKFAMSGRGPAVDGLWRSRILLPHGIDRLLSKRELHSVLMHELTHATRHDNFIRLVYEIALCGLWFHPLFWITGSRLALYRELSCDESVIQRGHGEELVSALAKLASSDEGLLLQATANSFLSHRLARLTGVPISRISVAANGLLAACFAVVLMGGVFATVAHTACCFVART
jgi:beta-lactamase regulating signal transducer with metallopeptidase domain